MNEERLLEDAAKRFKLPHCPEHELSYYGRLRRPELSAELAGCRDLARRGRLKRFLGDKTGAALDLRAALDRDPSDERAGAWLAELTLGDGPPGFYRGAALLLRGKPKEALVHLPEDSVLRGRALEALGRREEAVASYRRAGPGPAGALLAARLLKGEEAERACEDAFDAEPDYAHLALFQHGGGKGWHQYLRGLLAFSLDEERAKALCARFSEQDVRYSPYHYDAVAMAERMLRAHPGRAWSHALLGRALSRLPGSADRRAEALEHLDRAVALAPERGWPLAWRALARVASEPEKALRDLDLCLERQPWYYRAYAWRGALLRRLGKDGLTDLDRAVAVDERYPFSIHERSLARRAAGDLAGAAFDLDRAFALDFRYSWVYTPGREPSREELEAGLKQLPETTTVPSLQTWRGDLLLKLGRRTEALRALRRAVQLDPHHAHAWALLGDCARAAKLEPRVDVYQAWLADSQEPRAALKTLAALLKRRPRAWWAHIRRAKVLLGLGRAAEALKSARAAAGLEGRDAEAYYVEALALRALGRRAEARAAVEKTLAVAPNLGRAYVLRAELGTPEETVRDYRIALERFPYLFNEEEKGRLRALLANA